MVKYNFFKTTTFYLLLGLAIASCEQLSDFGDINKDKNASTESTTKFLLTRALSETRGVDVESMNRQNLFVQYFSETQYPGGSLYDSGSVRFNFFSRIYRDILFPLKLIKEANEDEEKKKDAAAFGYNKSQIAISEILSCYFYQLLTDCTGSIPYSQALGEGKFNFQPKYDSQESVYKDIFKRIDAAIKLIENVPSGVKKVQGDILFKGDLEKWKRFANMLRATAAMRISAIDSDLAQQEYLKSKNSGMLIKSNKENIGLIYLNTTVFENPWYSHFRSRSDYAISDVFVDFLKERKDKRLHKIAEKAPDLQALTSGEFDVYNGLKYGLKGSTVGEIKKSTFSLPSKVGVRKRDRKFYYYTYAQSLFLQAEAEFRLFGNNSEAKQHYENAIKASFEQWGVEDKGYYAKYLADPKVKWTADKEYELLGEQKWIALFLQGHEAWASWRKLNYPALKPAPDAVNDAKIIPLRLQYPESEENNNSKNHKEAIKAINVDNETVKVWWDR